MRQTVWRYRKKIDGFEITSLGGVFFEDDGKKYFVVGDLHLGMEDALRQRGISLPKKQLSQIKRKLSMVRDLYGDDLTIILNGDIKHEFSEMSYNEMREVTHILEYLLERFEEVIVIRGNHDNYVVSLLERKGIELIDHFETTNFYVEHGHRDVPYKEISKHIILSHEHPAVTLRDDVGASIKLGAFLVYRYEGNYIIITPSFSSYSAGADIVRSLSEEFFINVLNEIGIENFSVYGIFEDEILYLGKVGEIKKATTTRRF